MPRAVRRELDATCGGAVLKAPLHGRTTRCHGRSVRLQSVTALALRPLEVRVRNGVAVRIVGRVAERLVDPRLELLGERVLEPVGLVVHLVDVDAERLGEVQLEQAVVADHLERDPLALRRQGHPAVRRVLDERERGELLHHRARGGRRDVHLAREGGRRDAVARGAELVDLAQVVLDRVAERNHPRHVASVRAVLAS